MLAMALTANAGATDAIGFIALGGAFTSVMTGNLVLFGISISDGDGNLARHILTAVLSYIAGCTLGTRLAGVPVPHQPVWPRAVTRALIVEFVLFAVFAGGWWASHSHPAGVVQLALLSANALALGIQSSSVKRFGVDGLSTTYMTGTLTTVVGNLTAGHGIRAVSRSLGILTSLIGGAICAALLVERASLLAPLIQLCAVGGTVIASARLIRTAHRTDELHESPRDPTRRT